MSLQAVIPPPDANNEWRLATPGSDGWGRSPRPDAADKFFMVSADGHVQEPSNLWTERIDPKYHERLPGIVLVKGEQAQKTEGFRQPLTLAKTVLEGEDKLRNGAGKTPEARIADLSAGPRGGQLQPA